MLINAITYQLFKTVGTQQNYSFVPHKSVQNEMLLLSHTLQKVIYISYDFGFVNNKR